MTEGDRHFGTLLRESELGKVTETASFSVIRDPSVTEKDAEKGIGAGSGPEISEPPKPLRPGCSHPGCRVPPEIASYIGPDGCAWCISHFPDKGPKQQATRNGAEVTRRRRIRFMPPETLNPDWSTPKALRAWLEDRAGRIERGEIDPPAVPTKLAEIARGTHTDEALEKLDGIEALIRARLGGAA